MYRESASTDLIRWPVFLMVRSVLIAPIILNGYFLMLIYLIAIFSINRRQAETMQAEGETGDLTLSTCSLSYFTKTNTMGGYQRDIIPGQYEGGFKLWECTVDMLKWMEAERQLWQGKRVIEMGCGHGLLGIMAAKMGASAVCLQDYNQQVIDKLTAPTLILNNCDPSKFSLISGDWGTLKAGQGKYDIIIGSELIYSQSSYPKIVAFLTEFLSPNGQGILANKFYYFGVGGGMPSFRKAVETVGFKCETVSKIVPDKGGNKKEIVRITHQS